MVDQKLIESWLISKNAQYRSEEIPPSARPFKALSDYSREFKCVFSFDSLIAKTIVNWFHKHSKPESHYIGSMFTGAFYFDVCFWPLDIFIGFGQIVINPLDCLESMPEELKADISNSPQNLSNLTCYWADCFDYAYGIEEILQENKLNPKALSFLKNADLELRGAVAQLIPTTPNAKAILSLRMACEIFLKALLVQQKNFTNLELQKLSHKIKDIADTCYSTTNVAEFKLVASATDVFPNVSERYDGNEKSLSEIWRALYITQIAATAVVRYYTDRNMRAQLCLDTND